MVGVNTLTALVLVHTAQNLPLAEFILSELIAQIPKDLRDAWRCDGLSEYNIRPATCRVAGIAANRPNSHRHTDLHLPLSRLCGYTCA